MNWNPFKHTNKARYETETVLHSIPFKDEDGNYAEFLVRRPKEAEPEVSLEEFKKMMNK